MRRHSACVVGLVGVLAFGSGCTSDSGGSGSSGGSGNANAGYTCQTGQLPCGESCVFVETDSANCGTCGNACPAGATCASGVCSCQSDLLACGSACVDENSDPNNCSTCGNACGPAQFCSAGVCSASCEVGLTECGSACVQDLQSNSLHCGRCDAACAGGQVCTAGECTCQSGTACGATCIDTENDPANCGACGRACTNGASCVAAQCTGGTGTGSTGGTSGTTESGGSTGTTDTGGSTGTTETTGSGGAQASGGTSTTGGAETGGTSGAMGGTAGAAGDGGGDPLQCASEPNPGEGGVVIDGCCVVVCVYDALTDDDGDGWGYELQAECVVAGSEAATDRDSCLPDPRADLPEPGDGTWFPEVGETGEPACIRACDDPAVDTVDGGEADGWGWEYQASCIVEGSATAAQGIPCIPESTECNGDGYVICMDDDSDSSTPCVDTCIAQCEHGNLTDVDEECAADGDGWGWEMGANCLVEGSASAPQALCCTVAARSGLPEAGSGYMADTDGSGVYGDAEDEVCMPPCSDDVTYEDSCAHWGYEDGQSCIDPAGIAAAQTVPCVYQALTTDPPTGDGWNGDYTTTFFGEVNCQSLGADDFGDTNISQSVCPGNNVVQLVAGENDTWFGALGDLSTFWEGSTCTCPNGASTCVPTCATNTCGRCFEVACNPGGTYYMPNDSGNTDTHNGLCRTDQSVVVELIDVCPHNHSNNSYWCTDQRPNHIDISCSAFTEITNGRVAIADIGSLNVWVRSVDCSVGLGVREITH